MSVPFQRGHVIFYVLNKFGSHVRFLFVLARLLHDKMSNNEEASLGFGARSGVHPPRGCALE